MFLINVNTISADNFPLITRALRGGDSFKDPSRCGGGCVPSKGHIVADKGLPPTKYKQNI